ncbi:hypothetical protein M2152_000265 [Microbacteriaceae bacterium SG_E_30_P1]|uniref:Uncharacterized protein n=1 Tax=Antiquaquibacter oligotrophicus TaxID=2880260 RepID=A0ABT6KKV7_9MICO|nr:hypothetical protein [Antiquaquibacter oligotrophicus]MDH6180083.1 hypothetical protein [Antiquaquibacter oligotrophicus]UDF14166.1 hypothetical protein LH407_04715 [Antiquaquibacter oligotrophicus]
MMIIDSGYGLHFYMFRDERDRESTEVRIVCLDENLRLVHFARIADTYRGSLDEHAAEIREAVGRERVKYFAIGHRLGRELSSTYENAFDDDSEVIKDLEAQGRVFLGHQLHGDETWASSGPMYFFESYFISENVPRILIIPGPHPFLDCTCAYCGPREEKRRAAAALHAGSEGPLP